MATAKKLPSGSWRCLVYDYTDSTGRRKYKSFTSNDPSPRGKREVEFQAAEYAREKEHKIEIPNITLYDAIEKYISMSDGVLSPSTISNYQRMKENGFQSLMPLKLNSITTNILKEAVNMESKRVSTSSKSKGKVISPKTVSNEYGLITAVLNTFTNIDCRVKLPQKVNTIKEIIPPERIYEMVKGSEIELPVLLAMWLSFSMSELQGLYKSKSLQGDYLVIADVEIMVNGKYVQKKQGKTYTRNRKHHVPEYLMNLIHEVKTDKIVTLNGQAIHHRFTRMLDNCQLPHMTFHDLRHINASVMSMLNIPDKYAQERGGWKTDRVMKKIYTHTFSSERVLVDQKIDAYFNGILGNETHPNLDKEKYKSWLTLFDKKDSKESLEAFQLFMQHEMQHE